MSQEIKKLDVYEEDILNLENIRNIMMNLGPASKVANMDIRPEMLTLNGLINQFKEKNEAKLLSERKLAMYKLFKEVYGLSDVRAVLLHRDIEAILAKHS